MEAQENNKIHTINNRNKAISLVTQYLKDKNINNAGDIFIIQFCHSLGNLGYLITTSNLDKYFEVTYNKSKDKWHINVFQ